MSKPMNFDEYWKSGENYISQSTDLVKHFGKDAVREAFNAGVKFGQSKRGSGEKVKDTFTFQ